MLLPAGAGGIVLHGPSGHCGGLACPASAFPIKDTQPGRFRMQRAAKRTSARGQGCPVRSLHPNEFSLYDTHGNVWETGFTKVRRAMRGSTPDVVRLANRGREYADMRFTSGGFRLVRQLAP